MKKIVKERVTRKKIFLTKIHNLEKLQKMFTLLIFSSKFFSITRVKKIFLLIFTLLK